MDSYKIETSPEPLVRGGFYLFSARIDNTNCRARLASSISNPDNLETLHGLHPTDDGSDHNCIPRT
jgi:hypothetical protein